MAAGSNRAPYTSAWRLLLATTLLASVADAGLLTGGRSKQGEIAGETGAWRLPTGFDYHLDMPFALGVSALVGPGNTLLDFGAGKGHWSRFMGALGVKVTAIDGASNISHITQRFVQQRELTRRFAKPCRTFDWVMSMEVAEHIPDAYEDTYLANLNCSLRAGLVFSWSRHGPPLGTGHVNPHEKMWVINKMKSTFGLELDRLATKALIRQTTTAYLKEAILIFRRPGVTPTHPSAHASSLVPPHVGTGVHQIRYAFALLQTQFAELASLEPSEGVDTHGHWLLIGKINKYLAHIERNLVKIQFLSFNAEEQREQPGDRDAREYPSLQSTTSASGAKEPGAFPASEPTTAPPTTAPAWLSWLTGHHHQESQESPRPRGTVRNVPESQRSYSSIYQNSAIGKGYARSMLNSKLTWAAGSGTQGQYVQMDAGLEMELVGVATQGRADWDQWVTAYNVSTSTDGSTFTSVGSYTGNTDRSTIVHRFFATPVRARWVRIQPTSWHGYISMRCAMVSTTDESDNKVELQNTHVRRHASASGPAAGSSHRDDKVEPPKTKAPISQMADGISQMPEFYAKFVTFMETEMGYTSEYAKESASIIMSRAFEKKQSAFQPFFRRMHLRASEQGGE